MNSGHRASMAPGERRTNNRNRRPASKSSPAGKSTSGRGGRANTPPVPANRTGSPRIYVAVDTSDFAKARELVASLKGVDDVGFKVGLEFFTAHGNGGVNRLIGDLPLFLDLKFHDIPTTVAGAVKSVASLKPTVLNVHASGGVAMMRAAKEALLEAGGGTTSTKLIAVTVLTSMDQDDLAATGVDSGIPDQVLRLAKQTKDAGLDGIVCSAREAGAIRDTLGEDFMRVTPGMRVSISSLDDQKRSMSPADAFTNGSSHLVVGRLVTRAPDPAAAVRSMLSGLSGPKA